MRKSNKRQRQSGLKSINPNAGSRYSQDITESADMDFSYDCKNIHNEISILTNIQDSFRTRVLGLAKKRAFKVTYVEDPNLILVCFTTNKDKAKSKATRYYRDIGTTGFTGTDWKRKYNKCRAVIVPDLDQYIISGKAPIHEIMKLGATFPCSICGSDNFTYKDFEDGRCFVVEDEGDTNDYVGGYLLCYNCKKKFLG